MEWATRCELRSEPARAHLRQSPGQSGLEVRHLSLRARLVTGIFLVISVQVAAAFFAMSLTREQFLDQVDDRLEVAVASVTAEDFVDSDAEYDGPGGDPDGRRPFGDLYQARLLPDRSVAPIRAVNAAQRSLPKPVLAASDVTASLGGPITTELDESGDRYRLRSLAGDDGVIVMTAIPLDDVERRLDRMTIAIAGSAALVIVVLALMTWWVVRLGIRPLKAMTRSAGEIAAGDLSARVSETDPTTEAGQLGNALNTMMGRIEDSFDERARADERLRRFVADASHELRTPVSTIQGYADLYEAGGLEQRDELDDALRRVSQEAGRMSRLISDLLRLAQLDRGPTPDRSLVDLELVVRDLVADVAAANPTRSIELLEPVGSLLTDGDEDLLRQAIGNVIGNAITHTEAPASVSVAATRAAGSIVVRVADDGNGMSAGTVERATERFFRGDRARSRSRGGSGLGLAIVDSVIAAHDGQLEIDSNIGDGTTVTLTVPARPKR